MIINRLRLISNRLWFIWILLAIPLTAATVQYLAGYIYYGEYLHVTGEFSVRLLMLTLAVTPLRLAWPASGWTRWLLQNRRYFGVAAFVYALPHLVAYLYKVGLLKGLGEDLLEPGMWTGWLALLLFVPLAITSNKVAVRRLGKKWGLLHKLVYVAALFTFLHWLLVAYDPVPALIHAGILALLMGYRGYKSLLD